jgi:hypothetical protein
MITKIVSTLTAAVIAFSGPGLPAATADPARIAAETKADHVLIVGMPPGIAYAPTATSAESRPCTERRRRQVVRPDP